eukprot:CAMPEP_0172520038 /NCGR_PEP_ID=MMETSP1066-20121228/291768_1 /TAXON_ID=671091 /ORGANISM="Coscinodiscus wailesii, Strain CCMP2513" /LENGTH=102 /DNA_ID=CAMNT_0013302725 /DNA_START=428 /DNA_END=736 /DNA_ORIENTATION=-
MATLGWKKRALACLDSSIFPLFWRSFVIICKASARQNWSWGLQFPSSHGVPFPTSNTSDTRTESYVFDHCVRMAVLGWKKRALACPLALMPPGILGAMVMTF